QFRRIEQEAVAALVHDLAEGALGVDASAIERTTASDHTLEPGDDLDTEAAQSASMDTGGFEIVALRPQWRPMFECVADDHQRLDWMFFGLIDGMAKQSAVLGPSRPMLNRRDGLRQLGWLGVPLVGAKLPRTFC